MYRVLLLVSLIALSAVTGNATEFSFGAYGGGALLTGGSVLDFGADLTYGLTAKYHATKSWRLTVDASRVTLSNTIAADSTGAIGSLKSNAAADFDAWRFEGSLQRLLLSPQSRFNVTLGGGAGLMNWRMIDPVGDTTFLTDGEHQGKLAFKASELFVSASTGFLYFLSSRTFLEARVRADYLTGAGANFATPIDDARDRWYFSAGLSLNVKIGHAKDTASWRLAQSPAGVKAGGGRGGRSAFADADGDGVRDEADSCLATPRGALVNAHGCPIDNDRDGVPDGLDDCPGTPAAAAGMVDVHGCLVDSDFDGVPDYRDRCPNNPVGATVDSTGCPLDGDGDGVPDGLDDCPHTLVGVKVDRYGCVDLALFAQPMVLSIDYAPGSFEVDARTKGQLEKLAAVLSVVPDIRLEVNAYTDDIGTDAANLRLSEKRANRVRDYLVAYGVATERIKPSGRGETNPVASNETADGRARNRRIEIIFFK